MTSVFLPEHLHVMNDGEESVKTLGIYSSRDAALAAVERFRVLPGLRDIPNMADHDKPGPAEGFCIDEYKINQDSWTEGYVTV